MPVTAKLTHTLLFIYPQHFPHDGNTKWRLLHIQKGDNFIWNLLLYIYGYSNVTHARLGMKYL